jgi:ABC-type branched-subunit amino acid transport system substrate-binding protein
MGRWGLHRVAALAAALAAGLALHPAPVAGAGAGVVKLGMNYPRTGPYFTQGLDQFRAAQMAVEEINGAGGILGRKVELVWRDSQSRVDVTRRNVLELIEKENVSMLFGGSASSVAVAAGEIAQQKGVPFFGTLTYSTATTGTEGHRYTFRECYDSWMGAKVLSKYLKKEFAGKKYFYITADYTWGWTTEDALRRLTGTTDAAAHPGVKTPFPTATAKDFKTALDQAAAARPDVLVLVLFGTDMVNTINMATGMGLKGRMQLVVPNLTLGMAEDAGPRSMEGVLGALPWAWNIPFAYDYPGGRLFVERFAERYKRYPCTSGASAYVIVHEYKAAVERAGSFDGAAVVRALEGHSYTRLKDAQTWRAFDHQSVQTVYAVRCKSAAEVQRDRFKQDYFEILDAMPGAEAAVSQAEWKALRAAAGKGPALEKLPGE